MIHFPSKPDYTLIVAEFDVMLDKAHKVRLTKTINGSTTYNVECLTDGASDEVKELVQKYVEREAKERGVFDPMTK